MPQNPLRLDLRPAAETETVEDLVGVVRRGLVRIPVFQRPLRWEAEDVIQLFDSIYRGYPVGSFLLRKGDAPAARISIGPLVIDAPEARDALWVVDGQQRLTALTVGLSRPRPLPKTPDDPWVVYFDAAEQEFHAPPRTGEVPSRWVPVAELLDASELSEWVHHWQHGGDAALRNVVFQAGSRIRQYRIPHYVVETDDEQLLRDIFHRVNNYGRSMKWEDVHDALFGHGGAHPSTLRELAEELEQLGMGRPDEGQLLPCLLAFKGLDVTQNVAEHYKKDSQVLTRTVQEALPAIRAVLSFFKRHAEIPHLRLLPQALPLVVLTRFFALYQAPTPRTLELLTRWTWRTLLGATNFDERTLLRRGVAAIAAEDEEEAVQELLLLVAREPRTEYVLPSRFDARAAKSRIALLGMSSLRPLKLDDQLPIDVACVIEEKDVDAFRRIVPTDDPVGRSPANRILLPGSRSARKEIVDVATRGGLESPVLRSHALSPAALEHLFQGDVDSFVRERGRTIEEAVERLVERLAAWSRTDRPSIPYLLEHVDATT